MVKGAGTRSNTGASDVIFVMNKLTVSRQQSTYFYFGGRLIEIEWRRWGTHRRAMHASLRARCTFSSCPAWRGRCTLNRGISRESRWQQCSTSCSSSGGRSTPVSAEVSMMIQMFEYLEKRKISSTNACSSYDVLTKSAGLFTLSFSDDPLLAANRQSSETELALQNLASYSNLDDRISSQEPETCARAVT